MELHRFFQNGVAKAEDRAKNNGENDKGTLHARHVLEQQARNVQDVPDSK